MKILLLTTILYFSVSSSLICQEKMNVDYQKYWDEAEREFRKGNYSEAQLNYEIVLESEKEFQNTKKKLLIATECKNALDSIPYYLKIGRIDDARLKIAFILRYNSYDKKALQYNYAINEYLKKQPLGMVYVPGGKLKNGEVIKDFFVMRHEVTVSQYCEFLNKEIPGKDEILRWIDFNNNSQIELIGGIYKPQKGMENFPVINVSWYGAFEFAEFYGYELPTSWEWDYIAFSNLKENENMQEYSWLKYNSKNSLHPVAEYKNTPNGIYDLYGNAWEWTADCYFNKGNYMGTCSNRLVAGGSYRTDFSRLSSYLNYQRSETMMETIGFRCIKRMSSDIVSKRPSFNRQNQSYAQGSTR